MRYLVTGATGFIGCHLVARLKNQGHWVRALDQQLRSDREHLYRRADDVVKGDLREPNTARFACAGIDRVYHLAADHGGAGYFHSEHDQPAARNNMLIDLNMLTAAEQSGVGRLFYASSFCAYPTAVQYGDFRLSEDLLFQGTPEACYGAEKRYMTQLCEAGRLGGRLDARCGVFATIFGPLQESEGIRAKFPTAIVRRALNARDGDEIELWGDGHQIRTFLYIEDALDRIQTILDHDRYEGPVNVASDEVVTVQQCAEWACEDARVSPIFDYRPDRPTGVDSRIPDNTLFRARYGDGFGQLPTREGFRRLSRWLSAVPEKLAA